MKSARGAPYTPEMDNEIVQRIKSGQSYDDIAKAINRTGPGIESRCRILRNNGLLPKSVTYTRVTSIRADPPSDVISERDRAYSAVPTLDQIHFGTPMAGRSALDRMGKP